MPVSSRQNDRNSLFSVIIPTFNRQQTIRRAIDSVFAQSITDIEVIVVDDGSLDETSVVMADYTDARMKYIRHTANLGQNAALNTGVKAADGEFVAFLDSDDEWQPTFLERVLQQFSLNQDLGCVYTWANIVDATTGKIEVAEKFEAEGDIYAEALYQGHVSHMITLVIRRGLLFEVGLFDEEFEVCQDDDICIRLAKVARFGLVPEPLATIHMDAGNQVTKNKMKYADGTWKLITKFSDEILRQCGNEVLARHFERCGDYYWLANDFTKSFHAYAHAGHVAKSIRIGIKLTGVKFQVSPNIILKMKNALKWFYKSKS